MGQRGRPRHPDVLTPREQDVLVLIRDGLTNEQIAARLGISFDTAKTHVAAILSKLGVSTREEAAAWRQERRGPSLWRLLGAAAGLAIVASAVAGLALLSWGLSRSGVSESGTASSLSTIVNGPVYYLPPNDGSPEIASPSLLEEASIQVVGSGSDLFSLAPADLTAVIIDKTRFTEVNQNWLAKQALAGKVIVGVRMNMNDLLQMLDATPSGGSWTTYGPDRNFASVYSECQRSAAESDNHSMRIRAQTSTSEACSWKSRSTRFDSTAAPRRQQRPLAAALSKPPT